MIRLDIIHLRSSDEPVESLGESLKLPAWLETHRDRIEATLPALHETEGATTG